MLRERSPVFIPNTSVLGVTKTPLLFSPLLIFFDFANVLSCSDTCQIWTWYSMCNYCLTVVKKNGKINWRKKCLFIPNLCSFQVPLIVHCLVWQSWRKMFLLSQHWFSRWLGAVRQRATIWRVNTKFENGCQMNILVTPCVQGLITI